MTYPYLGVKEINADKNVIIFFTERDKGVVVMDTTNLPEFKFGKYGEFNEDDFDFLREGVCVRLNN